MKRGNQFSFYRYVVRAEKKETKIRNTKQEEKWKKAHRVGSKDQTAIKLLLEEGAKFNVILIPRLLSACT